LAAARSSIRFGLGRSNVESDIALVMEHLPRAVERLRAMAPDAAGVGALNNP
jgi:cysteine sulfinate desulfinase/cysteine desulfurase-like protein